MQMKRLLFFVAIALSAYVSAQDTSVDNLKQIREFKTISDARQYIENFDQPKSNFTGEPPLRSNQQRPREVFDLIHHDDSIYQWTWDPTINNWLLYSKIIDILYDAQNNWIS